MSTLEEAAQSRLDFRAKQADVADKQANIEAVKDGAQDIVEATQPLAKTTDIDSLIKQVKEVQLAAMLGASKPSVVLTDQTDLGERITALGQKIADTVSKLDTSKADTQQLAAIKELKTAFDSFTKTLASNNKSDTTADKALLTAIKAINVSPIVNVPQPKVTVEAQKIDFSPFIDALNNRDNIESSPDESLDLSCYRAQDIDNTNPDMQYIGFVNPEGNWYIIENNIKGNSFRYVFGSNGYQKAFSKAASYEYSLLNEAVNAIRT